MNALFLLAAVLLGLLALAHAYWGETRIFPRLPAAGVDAETRLSLYIPWHQLTYVLALGAVGLLLGALRPDLRVLPAFVLAIVAGNMALFFVLSALKGQRALIGRSAPQIGLFAVLIALIALGLATSG